MNKYIFCNLLFFWLVIFPSKTNASNELDKLNLITEDYPPYNFEEKGLAKGSSVELLMAAFAQVSNPISVEKIAVLPWTRAYKMAITQKNVVLFSTNRSPERESLFHWVGPIADSRVVLLARKSRQIKIRRLEDLSHYTIGVIKDDIGEQLLTREGMPKLMLEYINNPSSLVKMIHKGRIDLWAYEESVAHWFLKHNNFNSDDFNSVYTLSETQLYYALSKDINHNEVNLLQLGFDRLKCQRGENGMTLYENILSHYGL